MHLAPVVVTEEWPKGSGRLGGANVTEGYEEAFAEVRKTPAGRRLAEFADAPRRREKAG